MLAADTSDKPVQFIGVVSRLLAILEAVSPRYKLKTGQPYPEVSQFDVSASEGPPGAQKRFYRDKAEPPDRFAGNLSDGEVIARSCKVHSPVPWVAGNSRTPALSRGEERVNGRRVPGGTERLTRATECATKEPGDGLSCSLQFVLQVTTVRGWERRPFRRSPLPA